MKIIFESHATTIDNEAQIVSGWYDAELTTKGKQQGKDLGKRYKASEIDAIFTSDLQRAHQTATLAFPEFDTKKIFQDWRLRECDYGEIEHAPKKQHNSEKHNFINAPHPGGESYKQAMERMRSFVEDLKKMPYKTVMVVGSRATHYGLDVWIDGKTIEECLAHEFVWQPGWVYEL